MSVPPCAEEFDEAELQTWNTAAFIDDLRKSGDTTWPSPRTELVRSDEYSKENRSPNGENRIKILNKSPPPVCNRNCEESSGKDIDAEIEEIEEQISRLSVKLDALRLEKVEKSIRDLDMNSEKKAKETVRVTRRGVSLGPMEIASGLKFRPVAKPQTATPILSTQSRRKSCFWKLQEIDELKVTKDRRKSLGSSPKSRKAQSQRQAVTTVASKKGVKKEGVILSIQPKKLFDEEGERSVAANKPVKSGRTIASRYNLINKGKEEGKEKKSLLNNTPLAIGNVTDVLLLPKIKAMRCLVDSSRDSGCAKRGYFDDERKNSH